MSYNVITGAIENDGTNLFITENNIRYTLAKTLTTTQVLDFPNTAAGNTSDLTITLTGAVIGDGLIVTIPSTSIPGAGTVGFYSWWISAADTVTVRFSNPQTLASINPGSGTFRAIIFKYT